jgi:hypothetical protein
LYEVPISPQNHNKALEIMRDALWCLEEALHELVELGELALSADCQTAIAALGGGLLGTEHAAKAYEYALECASEVFAYELDEVSTVGDFLEKCEDYESD